jgi:hypothetical protein
LGGKIEWLPSHKQIIAGLGVPEEIETIVEGPADYRWADDRVLQQAVDNASFSIDQPKHNQVPGNFLNALMYTQFNPIRRDFVALVRAINISFDNRYVNIEQLIIEFVGLGDGSAAKGTEGIDRDVFTPLQAAIHDFQRNTLPLEQCRRTLLVLLEERVGCLDGYIQQLVWLRDNLETLIQQAGEADASVDVTRARLQQKIDTAFAAYSETLIQLNNNVSTLRDDLNAGFSDREKAKITENLTVLTSIRTNIQRALGKEQGEVLSQPMEYVTFFAGNGLSSEEHDDMKNPLAGKQEAEDHDADDQPVAKLYGAKRNKLLSKFMDNCQTNIPSALFNQYNTFATMNLSTFFNNIKNLQEYWDEKRQWQAKLQEPNLTEEDLQECHDKIDTLDGKIANLPAMFLASLPTLQALQNACNEAIKEKQANEKEHYQQLIILCVRFDIFLRQYIAGLNNAEKAIDNDKENVLRVLTEGVNALLHIQALPFGYQEIALKCQMRIVQALCPIDSDSVVEHENADDVSSLRLENLKTDEEDFAKSQAMLDQILCIFDKLKDAAGLDLAAEDDSELSRLAKRFIQLHQSLQFCNTAMRTQAFLDESERRLLLEKIAEHVGTLEAEVQYFLNQDANAGLAKNNRNLLQYLYSASQCMRIQLELYTDEHVASPLNAANMNVTWDITNWLEKHFNYLNGDRFSALSDEYKGLFLASFDGLVQVCDSKSYVEEHLEANLLREKLPLFFKPATIFQHQTNQAVIEKYYVEKNFKQVQTLFAGNSNSDRLFTLLGLHTNVQSFEVLFFQKHDAYTNDQQELHSVLRNYVDGCDNEFDVYLAMFKWERRLTQSIAKKESSLLFAFCRLFKIDTEEHKQYREDLKTVKLLHSAKQDFYKSWIERVDATKLHSQLSEILHINENSKVKKSYDSGNIFTRFFSESQNLAYIHKKSLKEITNSVKEKQYISAQQSIQMKKKLFKAGVKAIDTEQRIAANGKNAHRP